MLSFIPHSVKKIGGERACPPTPPPSPGFPSPHLTLHPHPRKKKMTQVLRLGRLVVFTSWYCCSKEKKDLHLNRTPSALEAAVSVSLCWELKPFLLMYLIQHYSRMFLSHQISKTHRTN